MSPSRDTSAKSRVKRRIEARRVVTFMMRPLRLDVARRGPFLTFLLFATFWMIVASHRLADLFHPQYFEEEGSVFFPTAYRDGVFSVFQAYVGHLDLVPRLAAWAVQPLGLAGAPLVFKCVALAIQVLPALFVLSDRMEHVIPRRPARLLLAALYLAIPMSEGQANLTNSSWYLALLALLIVVARPPTSRVWRFLNLAAVGVAVLDGGVGVLLLPLSLAAYLLLPRASWRRTIALTVSMCGVPQLIAIALSQRSSTGPLWPPHGQYLIDIMVAVRVAVPAVAGFAPSPAALEAHLGRYFVEAISAATVVSACLTVLALLKGPIALRLLVILSLGVFLFGLLDPPSGNKTTLWTAMALAGGAQRYFILPILAGVGTALWALTRLPARRVTLSIYASLVLAGSAIAWRLPPLPDYHPARMADAFATAPSGTRVTFPVFPQQTMTLVKR